MIQFTKTVASFVWSEMTLDSSYGVQTNIDTFRRWAGTIIFCVCFYSIIYYLEDFWLWMSRVSSYTYVPTSPGKIRWHRLTFGFMAFVIAASATIQYIVHLTRRIRAHCAACNASQSQSPPT